MKKIFIFLVLVIVSSSLTFAQSERKGTITGTFGVGIGFCRTIETAPQISFMFDLNLINRTGFTLCLTNVVSVHNSGPSQNLMFGAGYYFLRDSWNIGGAILAAPAARELILGGKINGGYYFSNDIGVTGTVIYRRAAGISWDFSMLDVFIGPTIRF